MEGNPMTSPQRRAAAEAVRRLNEELKADAFPRVPDLAEIESALAPFFAAPPAEVGGRA